MALFSWQCTKCSEKGRCLKPARPKLAPCPKCGAEQRFTTQVQSMKMDTLDNGVMVRKIERLHNVEELNAERNAKADSVNEDPKLV